MTDDVIKRLCRSMYSDFVALKKTTYGDMARAALSALKPGDVLPNGLVVGERSSFEECVERVWQDELNEWVKGIRAGGSPKERRELLDAIEDRYPHIIGPILAAAKKGE